MHGRERNNKCAFEDDDDDNVKHGNLSWQNINCVVSLCCVNFLGYLTTEDENAPGNWGFSDQVQALDFVKKNIRAFRGDPEKITLMGDTAGAVSVGLHLISPASRRKGCKLKHVALSSLSRLGYRVVRIDLLHFLTACRTRRLNQV